MPFAATLDFKKHYVKYAAVVSLGLVALHGVTYGDNPMTSSHANHNQKRL